MHANPANAVTVGALIFVALLFIFTIYEVVKHERELYAQRKATPPDPQNDPQPQETDMALTQADTTAITAVQALAKFQAQETARANAAEAALAASQSAHDGTKADLDAANASIAALQAQVQGLQSDHQALLDSIQAALNPPAPAPAPAITLIGGAGLDTISSVEGDTLTGGAGQDSIQA